VLVEVGQWAEWPSGVCVDRSWKPTDRGRSENAQKALALRHYKDDKVNCSVICRIL
jgi:hypothetical protein